MRHHVAQCNIARLREPLESPLLADFVASLEPINALADRAEGFLWRLQTEDGDATAIRVFEDDMLIVNMSVWESIDDLAAFTYSGDHLAVMRRRRNWFERIEDAYLVLWWVPAGAVPSLSDAQHRLELLRTRGPSADAFSFRTRFDPTGRRLSAEASDEWLCPT